jgi:hypothetical protein
MRLLLLILTATVVAFGQNYVCKALVIDEGGKSCTTSSYHLRGMSTGQQTASGVLSTLHYKAIIGFWHGPYAPSIGGISEGNSGVLTVPDYSLLPARPNPFRAQTSIRYSLPRTSTVNLDVISVAGRIVSTLVNGEQKPGCYAVTWDVSGVPRATLPSGVYFVRMRAGTYRATEKVVIE